MGLSHLFLLAAGTETKQGSCSNVQHKDGKMWCAQVENSHWERGECSFQPPAGTSPAHLQCIPQAEVVAPASAMAFKLWCWISCTLWCSKSQLNPGWKKESCVWRSLYLAVLKLFVRNGERGMTTKELLMSCAFVASAELKCHHTDVWCEEIPSGASRNKHGIFPQAGMQPVPSLLHCLGSYKEWKKYLSMSVITWSPALCLKKERKSSVELDLRSRRNALFFLSLTVICFSPINFVTATLLTLSEIEKREII